MLKSPSIPIDGDLGIRENTYQLGWLNAVLSTFESDDALALKICKPPRIEKEKWWFKG